MFGENIKGTGSPEEFREGMITTKQDILEQLKENIFIRCSTAFTINSRSLEDLVGTREYQQQTLRQLVLFYNHIETMTLFKELEDWWSYQIVIRDTGIELRLSHQAMPMYMEVINGNQIVPLGSTLKDQIFVLYKLEPKKLTVDDYCKFFHVKPATVRQWIRRGKLRGVTKEGTDWRISEMSTPPGRGYQPVQYEWEKKLGDVPEGFEMLNDYTSAYIQQNEEDRKIFLLVLQKVGVDDKILSLSADQREKLEYYLITNPNIKCFTKMDTLESIGVLRSKDYPSWQKTWDMLQEVSKADADHPMWLYSDVKQPVKFELNQVKEF